MSQPSFVTIKHESPCDSKEKNASFGCFELKEALQLLFRLFAIYILRSFASQHGFKDHYKV